MVKAKCVWLEAVFSLRVVSPIRMVLVEVALRATLGSACPRRALVRILLGLAMVLSKGAYVLTVFV